MDKKFEPLPIKEEGNGSNLVQLTIDKADIPMLVHALSIGAATVMMCGGGDALRRMRHYKKALNELVPSGWKHFRHEEDVSNIILAINDTTKCQFNFKKKGWREDGSVTITVGDRIWDTYSTTVEQALEMIGFLKEVLPLSCELEITGDLPDIQE